MASGDEEEAFRCVRCQGRVVMKAGWLDTVEVAVSTSERKWMMIEQGGSGQTRRGEARRLQAQAPALSRATLQCVRPSQRLLHYHCS